MRAWFTGYAVYLNSDIQPIKVVYRNSILNHTITNIPLNNGLYLLAVIQGGSWTLWGIAVISITAHTSGCGAIKIAGGTQFMNATDLIISASAGTLTLNDTTDSDLIITIIRVHG